MSTPQAVRITPAPGPAATPLGMPSRAPGPTVPRMVLGAQLRRLRETCGVTCEEAGEVIRASHSKISRLEMGRTGFKLRDVEDLLTLYGVTEAADRDTLVALAAQANRPGWWHAYHDVVPRHLHQYLGLEQAAEVIRSYQLQFVPGLLQTEDYARAVLRLGPDGGHQGRTERRLELRMQRQAVLEGGAPPRLWTVIDEAALRRAMGGRQVMRAQLAHLIEMSRRPNVTVQVMPFAAGGHPALSGSLTVLRLPGGELPDVVFLEHAMGGHYLDKAAEVERHRHIMNQVVVKSAPATETRQMLARIRAEL
ncbi:helix-turn-helix domain-containing protein [Streptomyces aidingensis]|uniref:Helix-turn-helix domain-containing protein n=1 Tax=Streptomyces aidingensis TaxID=910347 RepID=A0A1I1IS51_9ACTN|nr:helix-turn-helix transcriptional regulator [Streptomyces aidingensis]SFC38552.1 Helix-turn-helix domain-containing protein [Streptomyces aidingensis]